MNEVKKALYVGNSKFVNWDALDSAKNGRYEQQPGFEMSTEAEMLCEHAGHKFRVVLYSARIGIDSADMFLNLNEFKSKAAMVRFSSKIKKLIVETF